MAAPECLERNGTVQRVLRLHGIFYYREMKTNSKHRAVPVVHPVQVYDLCRCWKLGQHRGNIRESQVDQGLIRFNKGA